MILGLLGGATLWLALVEIQVGAPHEPSRWIHELMEIKERAARAEASPRILVYGGSGAHFGVSAEILSHELRMPAFNMATHAALQLSNLIFHAKSMLRSGDIVVLQLEYPYFTEDDELKAILVDYVSAYDLPYLKSLSWIDRMRFDFSLESSRLLMGLFAKVFSPPRLVIGYDSSTVRPTNGDETNNSRASMNAEQVFKANRSSPIEFFYQEFKPSPGVWPKLAEFVTWCFDRQIRVFAFFPPTVYVDAIYDDLLIQSNSRLLITKMREAGLRTFGSPESSRYERDLIFDTSWHLNDLGRQKHTLQIVSWMKPFIL